MTSINLSPSLNTMAKASAVQPYDPDKSDPRSLIPLSERLLNGSVTKLLSLELIDKVASEISIGAYPHSACGKLGITRNRYEKWMLKGEQLYISLPDEFDIENPLHCEVWDNFSIGEKLLTIFYIQVSLASSIARSEKEQQVFITSPQFWLQFGPGKVDWSPQTRVEIDQRTVSVKMSAEQAKEILRIRNG